MAWPHGPEHDLSIDGRARDLRTDDVGEATVLGAARLDAVIGVENRLIHALHTDPASPWPLDLLGRPTTRVRRAPGVRRLWEDPSTSLLATLVDELPVVAIISEGARRRLLGRDRRATPADQERDRRLIDVCAGWATGGAMARSLDEDAAPFLGHGRPVGDVQGGDDHAIHVLPARVPGTLRRLRRMDVEPTGDPGLVTVDQFFRDSYIEADGTETAVHEYAVTLEVRAPDHVITSLVASPHALPGPDCAQAAPHARRVVGVDLSGLRDRVESQLRGTVGCTHLNDSLRLLGLLDDLVDHVAR